MMTRHGMGALCGALVLLMASSAAARPGFYIGLGLGPTNVNGQAVPSSRFGLDDTGASFASPYTFTTEFANGFSTNVRMGFNILGYAAIETGLAGSSDRIFDAEKRAWAAHWQTGVRVYPAWHWQHEMPEHLQRLEPSIFVGVGTSYMAYNPFLGGDEVGWSDWGTWRYGFGLEYFLVSYFKIAFEYAYTRANFENFIYNFQDDVNFPVDPPATTGFHQVLLLGMFHFSPAAEDIAKKPE